MRITLTDLAIQHLKPLTVQTRYYCNRTPNFGVLVGKRTKSFFLITGRERRPVHLGKYPATTVAEARKKASALLDGSTRTASLTFPEAREAYLAAYVRPNYRARSAKEVERLLRRCNFKDLDVSVREVTGLLDTLPRTEANHVFGVLRTFYNWCERRELVPLSPIRKLTKPHKERSRDRVLTRDEIRRIWKATNDGSASSRIVRLCLTTGQRRGELGALCPEWIHDNIITFPKEITKNKREHSIPMTATIRAHIAAPTSVVGSWSIAKAKLDKASGVSNWVIHDLRRTVSTNLAELGVAPHIIDRLLNHRTNTLHTRYNRYEYMPEVLKALEAWEAHLLHIVSEEA